MEWLVIDENYLNYLRKVERRIPRSDYGSDKYKPFFGVLFETEDFYYVTQVSHAQKRHQNMKNNIDFKKIYDPDDNRLLAVINLNYMFPILKKDIVKLQYKDIHLHRTFKTEEEKSKYIDLMKTELKVINNMSLSENALKIYNNKYEFPDATISKRCIDFKNMEKLAYIYVVDLETLKLKRQMEAEKKKEHNENKDATA